MSFKQIYEIVERGWYRIIRVLIIPLSYLVCKRKDLWLYYPAHFKALAGDCIFLFNHVKENDRNIKQYILIDKYFIVKDSSYSEFIVNRYSLKGILLSLTAKVIIIDADGPFKEGNFNIVQLWHGTGYKNILALSGKYTLEYNQKRLKNIRFVPSSSEEDRRRKVKSFLTNRVYITGSPRNDFFFSEEAKYVVERLKYNLKIDDTTQVVLYAPTYRSRETFRPLSDSFFKQLQKIAVSCNFVFFIKRHPKDLTVYSLDEYSNIRDITNEVKDVQELLLTSDLLITDYSSIASDFALLDRPIVFYVYDFEHYVKNQRGFYYDLKKVLPGPFANSEQDLLNLIENRFWAQQEVYQNKFKSFQNLFHKYRDGNSSKRVYTQILKLIEENEI